MTPFHKVCVLYFFLLIGFCSLSSAPQAKRFSFPWLSNLNWKNKAEIAIYSGIVKRYGEKRSAKLTLISVLEHFHKTKAVKSESAEDAIWALKQNQILTFRTGVYPYNQMNSLFWTANSGRFLKASMSSQEWCGHTFKEIRPYSNHFQLSYNSYWEEEARGFHRITFGDTKNIDNYFSYDELPFIVRSQDIDKYTDIYLFPLLMSSQVLRPDFDTGKPSRIPTFSRAKVSSFRSSLTLGQKIYKNIRKVQVVFSDPVQKNQKNIDTFYVHLKGKNKILLGWDRHDGSFFRLDEIYYTPYWKQNRKRDSLQNNRIKELTQ